MPKNYDQDVPMYDDEDVQSEPVQEKFDELKIYWGPNQPLTGYESYSNPADWRSKENLNIPIVVRMHNVSPGTYDTEEWDDDISEGCSYQVTSIVVDDSFFVTFALISGDSTITGFQCVAGSLPAVEVGDIFLLDCIEIEDPAYQFTFCDTVVFP